MAGLFLTAYVTILVAELVGDKTLYTLATLSARYRAWPIVAGAGVAFACKMALAVLFGRVIAGLPQGVLVALSTTTFLAMAAMFLLDRRTTAPTESVIEERFGRSAVTAFVAIFVPEWGDPGQLTAAALVATHGAPLIVFAGGVTAMVTKASLATWLGTRLRRFVPRPTMRYASAALCLVMALLSAFRIEL